MKNKIFSLFALLLVVGFSTSCSEDEDVASIVNVPKPTLSIAIAPVTTLAEGGIVPFELTLSEPVGQDFNFYVVLQQSSTADGSDTTVTEGLGNTTFQQTFTIPAFTTTFNGEIEISEDELTEGTETLVVQVGDTRTSAVTFQPVTATINITNVVSDDLVLTFNFDRQFSGANGYTNTLCEFENPSLPAALAVYDVDFVVYDDNFIPVTYPGSAGAQTGACPEVLTMSLSDYPDGLYHITSYLYTNGDLDTFPVITTPFNIPITVDYLRAGSIDKGTFTQESGNWFTSDTPVDDQQLVVDVLISTVAGVRKFTIQDTAGNISASGRSSFKSKHVNKK